MGSVPSELFHNLPYSIRDFLVHRAILRVVGISEPGAAEFLLYEIECWREEKRRGKRQYSRGCRSNCDRELWITYLYRGSLCFLPVDRPWVVVVVDPYWLDGTLFATVSKTSAG